MRDRIRMVEASPPEGPVLPPLSAAPPPSPPPELFWFTCELQHSVRFASAADERRNRVDYAYGRPVHDVPHFHVTFCIPGTWYILSASRLLSSHSISRFSPSSNSDPGVA